MKPGGISGGIPERGDDMSNSFEKQVFAALVDIMTGPTSFGNAQRFANIVAPRVTAAITAAGRVGLRSAEDGDRAREAALEALTGGSSSDAGQ